jgi:uncharacterized protein YcbK (DUF882 family)
VTLVAKLTAAVLAGAAAATITSTLSAIEPPPAHSEGLASRKGSAVGAAAGNDAGQADDDVDGDDGPPLLATLVQTHTGERVPLDARVPTQARFDSLLADRVTGEQHPLDEHLIGLLRQLAEQHPGSRIELVSGYRSWKLNEMLRKKGHHVASHSQHSLGHACDFRIVPPGADVGIDPRVVEGEIRKLGWKGGVGVYPTRDDWFVHADVGRERAWTN